MRPKVAVSILLLAVGLLGVMLWGSKRLHSQLAVPAGGRTNVSPVVSPLAAPKVSAGNLAEIPFTSISPAVSAPPTADTNTAVAHAEYVRQRIEELDALAMNDDVQSRDTILSELKNNPDKVIRAAALEAAIQFGDRSVVPQMQEIAAQTDDPDEKKNILDAIDYINEPSLTEYTAAHPDSAPPIVPGPPPADTPPADPQTPETQPPAGPPTDTGQ